jgi:hypothetical protein
LTFAVVLPAVLVNGCEGHIINCCAPHIGAPDPNTLAV